MESSAVVVVELQKDSTNFADIVAEIVNLGKKIFPEHVSQSRSYDDELRNNNTRLHYMMDRHGELVGYVLYSWPSSLSAFIMVIAVKVKERHRKQGHVEALLKAAIRKCRTRNVHRISLHVDPLRIAAMCLYEKLGFKVNSLI